MWRKVLVGTAALSMGLAACSSSKSTKTSSATTAPAGAAGATTATTGSATPKSIDPNLPPVKIAYWASRPAPSPRRTGTTRSSWRSTN